MKPAPLEYVAVHTVEEARQVLARYDGAARLLAGGQSLVPLLNMRLMRPAAVIDINGIAGLDEITIEPGNPVDVDHGRRPHQPHVQERDEALAAGEQARIAVESPERLQSLGDGANGDVLERSGLHRVAK